MDESALNQFDRVAGCQVTHPGSQRFSPVVGDYVFGAVEEVKVWAQGDHQLITGGRQGVEACPQRFIFAAFVFEEFSAVCDRFHQGQLEQQLFAIRAYGRFASVLSVAP